MGDGLSTGRPGVFSRPWEIFPLIESTVPVLAVDRFGSSIALTLLALFAVGASRALIAEVRWWRAGVEMLGLGAIVAAVAYGSGAVVAAMMAGT